MLNRKKIAAFVLVTLLCTGAYAAHVLIPNGMNDWGTYYVMKNNGDQYDLLRTMMLYRNNGPMTKVDATTGVTKVGITAADGSHLLACLTQEIVVNGKFLVAEGTAELYAWDAISGSTVTPGNARYYVVGCNGGTISGSATSYTIVAGALLTSTETTVMPAMTAGYAPLAWIKVSCGPATFTPGTDNFNATAVTTTTAQISVMPSGASLPAAYSFEYPDAYTINQ